MPNHYEISRLADHDIESILEYTFKHYGETQARKYTTELIDKFELLVKNPELGRACDDVRDGYRRLEYERHIIFYQIQNDKILIVRVIHDAMDLNTLFQAKGNA